MLLLVTTLGVLLLVGLSFCAAAARADESTERAMRSWPVIPKLAVSDPAIPREMPFSLN